MKKIFLYSLAASAIFFTGCLKDTPETDFSTVGTLAEIGTSSLNGNLNAPSGGLDYFKQATLPAFNSSAPYQVTFDVNIASPYPPNKDVNVTLGVDDSKRTAYNALGGVQFDAAPDSIYSFPVKTAVIKAGTRLATFTITFFPDKIDPSHSYLVPIAITDASGIQVSGNLGTIYIHNLGNPLAGPYTVTGTRYNYNGNVTWDGNPASVPVAGYVATTNLAGVKLSAPDDTKTVEVAFANVGAGYNYILSWDGTAGGALGIDYTFTSVYSNFQTVLVSFQRPDATHKAAFHIITHYNNAAGGAGNDRIMDESFVHQ